MNIYEFDPLSDNAIQSYMLIGVLSGVCTKIGKIRETIGFAITTAVHAFVIGNLAFAFRFIPEHMNLDIDKDPYRYGICICGVVMGGYFIGKKVTEKLFLSRLHAVDYVFNAVSAYMISKLIV